MSVCEKCNKNYGTLYNFYYGSVTYRYEGNRRITEYTAEGAVYTYICDSCIKNSYKRKALFYLITAIVLGVLCGFGISLAIIPAVCLLVTSIITFQRVSKPLTTYDGELMAIDMKNRAYRRQGYNGFYTTSRYLSLFSK